MAEAKIVRQATTRASSRSYEILRGHIDGLNVDTQVVDADPA